ncbi:hypothetical protein [Sulfurimonas sp.]|uniref:hypothetical protein n=2 Tax=Sulfurimonas sp. TaxID=2022749 RepID=UPI003D150C84
MNDIWYNSTMTKMEKFKRTVIIALGFAISTYLIMSGMAMLDQEKSVDGNFTSKVHSDTVE